MVKLVGGQVDEFTGHEGSQSEGADTVSMMRLSDIHRASRTVTDRWRQEWCPFAGIPAIGGITLGARFGFEKSPFWSYVLYERDVIEELRRVQRARAEFESPSPSSPRRRARTHAAALEGLEELVRHELGQVRSAVDWELEAGRGCPDTVGSLRALPARPYGVRPYRTVEDYVAADPRRAVIGWPRWRDLDGADYGKSWQLEDPARRWHTTQWRISWLGYDDPGRDLPRELYAVEREHNDGRDELGRVWLLATFPAGRSPLDRLFELLDRCAADRNSLAYVATVMREMAEVPSPP